MRTIRKSQIRIGTDNVQPFDYNEVIDGVSDAIFGYLNGCGLNPTKHNTKEPGEYSRTYIETADGVYCYGVYANPETRMVCVDCYASHTQLDSDESEFRL